MKADAGRVNASEILRTVSPYQSFLFSIVESVEARRESRGGRPVFYHHFCI